MNNPLNTLRQAEIVFAKPYFLWLLLALPLLWFSTSATAASLGRSARSLILALVTLIARRSAAGERGSLAIRSAFSPTTFPTVSRLRCAIG